MPTSQVFQIIAICATLLVAVFRNQLSAIGDKIVIMKINVGKTALRFLRIVVFYISPIFWITYDFIYLDFGKLFVLFMCLNFAILLFNSLFEIFMLVSVRLLSFQEKLLIDTKDLGTDVYKAHQEILKIMRQMVDANGAITKEVIKELEQVNEDISKLKKNQ